MSAAQTSRQETTVAYYEKLAECYDHDRFGNSYGGYVDAQERRVLRDWLQPGAHRRILDLACGTGRLLDLATHGLDASPAMVRIAQSKYPQKPIHCGPATELAKMGIRFDAIFCLHLFMHLPPEDIQAVLQVCWEALRPGGQIIFDLPSVERRRVTGFRASGWHAGTVLTHRQLDALMSPGWRCLKRRGILFFPIHRVPQRLRARLRLLDDLIGSTPLQSLSSYRLFCLERSS